MLITETHPSTGDLAQLGQLMLSVEESHADHLRRRYAQRPASVEKDRPALSRFENATNTGGYGYAVDGAGVAVVSINGVLTPEQWAWFDSSETITDWVVRDLAAIGNDAGVQAVLFAVNSPGGYVAGSYELSDAIAAVAAVKATASFITGYGASAAYLQTSQTGRITAYRTALVGSIGTRSAAVDAHAMFERFGVRIIPIDSGGMKSAGLFGTEITAEQLDYFRSLITKQQAFFTQAVADGRSVPLEQAQKWADGRIHVAGDAVSIGLIDAVGTMDDAYQSLLAAAKGPRPAPRKKSGAAKAEMTPPGGNQPTNPSPATDASGDVAGAGPEPLSTEESDMSQKQDAGAAGGAAPAPAEPKAATMAELRASCPGATSDFLVEQAEKGATVAQAKDAFLQFQAGQIRARDEDIKKLQAAKAPEQQEETTTPSAAKKAPGVPVLETKAPKAGATSDGGDFKAQVDALVKGGMSRDAAVSKAAREDPDAHQAYVDAANKRK